MYQHVHVHVHGTCTCTCNCPSQNVSEGGFNDTCTCTCMSCSLRPMKEKKYSYLHIMYMYIHVHVVAVHSLVSVRPNARTRGEGYGEVCTEAHNGMPHCNGLLKRSTSVTMQSTRQFRNFLHAHRDPTLSV